MERELTNYEQWQIEKYGNIAPTIDELSLHHYLENGCEDADRYREWVMMHHEIQMIQYADESGKDFILLTN